MLGTHGLKHLGLALLFVGACSAGKQNAASGIDFDPAGYDGFDETHFNLLTANCSFSSGNMTLTVGADETAYIFKRADGVIAANAMNGTNDCTMDPTKKITINSHDPTALTDEKVIIDFVNGVFGLNGGTPASPGIVVALGAGTGDEIKIRGTTAVDTFTFGTNTTTSTSYAAFQVAPAAARTVPDLSMAGVENVTVSTGAGNDTITAQGGKVLGTGVTALSGAISVTFYGGDGNDTLISGAASESGASNTLNGGADNDYFPQQLAKASDVIVGGAGTDTVDYSVRLNAVKVTLGATTAATAATGSFTAAAKTDIVDNEYFVLNDGVKTVRFAYQVTADSAATGSITVADKSLIADNDYFTLSDGTKTYNFEFKATAGGVQAHAPGAFIDITGAADSAAVAALIQTAIATAKTGTFLDMTAAAAVGTLVGLTSDNNGAGVAIADHTTAGSFTFVGMTGGSDFAADVESAENLAASAVIIDISAATTAGQVAAATFTAINGEHTGTRIDITPTNPNGDAVIPLTADTAGEAANVTIATSTTPKFVVAGMSGGSDEQLLDDGETGELDSVASDVENVMGGAGNDTINASASGIAHVLMGMAGADTLTGAADVDYIYGGAGNDTLIGGGGADFLYGGADNDFLQGGALNDTINGGGANCVGVVSAADPVVPFVNVTTCSTKTAAPAATPGIDTLDYSERAGAVTVNLLSLDCTVGGTVVGEVGECDIVTSGSIRNIRGGSGADTLTGDAQDNVIWGGNGNDTISGGEGNDSLYGGVGVDTINGGAGNDYVCGGAGSANVLNGDDGLDTVDASMGTSDVVNCGAGDGDILILGTTTVNASGTCEM